MPLRIGKREEAGDAAVGVTGPVVPARDRVDRDIRLDVRAVAVRAEGGRRDGRIGGERVVLETELANELRHAKVALMLGHGRASETAFRIVIDGLRSIEVGVLEIGKLAQEIAPVLIERDHQLVVGLGETVEQQPARIVVIGIGVPHGKQRRDGLHRGVAGARQEVRCGADVGDARRADRPVGPRLPHDPIGDLAIVLTLRRRAEAVAHAEAGAGAAHVANDHGIAARDEQIAPLAGVGARLRRRRGTGPQLEAPVIGRQDQKRRQLGPGRIADRSGLWEIDVERQPASVPHRDVLRARRAHAKRCRPCLGVVGRRHPPPFTGSHDIGHGGNVPFELLYVTLSATWNPLQ